MKRFFGSKAIKIIGSIVLVIALAVGISSAVFAKVALTDQVGGVSGNAWSEQDVMDESKIKSLDIGTEDYKILCLTDVHRRNHATFASFLGVNFILDGMSEIQLKKMIKREKPNMIIVTGDSVLTEWNDIELKKFVDFMDQFQIPWAHVFGNHEFEGRADKSKLAEVLLASEYGLFECGPADMNGLGNYIVNLKRADKTAYSLFMFDNGEPVVANGTTDAGGINKKQVAWYEWAMKGINAANGTTVPSMAFMHIPLPEYKDVQEVDWIEGARREDVCSPLANDGFYSSFESNGGTHIFAGHDHVNNFLSKTGKVSLNYVNKSSYNCYIDLKVLGGTTITINPANEVAVKHVFFNEK